MQFKIIFFVSGMLLFCLGCAMALPIFTAWYYNEDMFVTLISAVLLLSVGAITTFFFRPQGEVSITSRESIAVVAFCWLTASIGGTLPYLLGTELSFADALFEAVSGFTTTGASVISDVEALSRGVLMWRACTHWLGGMGIIVLTLAILPMLGMGGMQLYKAEVTGPQIDKLMPRIHDTALYLWIVYFMFTLVQFVLLMLGGLDWFNALAHTFATVATGGFSTQNTSLIHYSAYIQWVVIIFMFLAGANFSLHYKFLITGRLEVFSKNSEFKVYGIITCIASLIIAGYLLTTPENIGLEKALRDAFFQVISICTSTGFATADYLQWSFLSQSLILLVMIMGACAGSTGGGLKVMRCVLLQKVAKKEVLRVLHPRAIHDIKYESKSVSQDVLNGVMAFVIIYVGIVFVGGMFITAFGYDFVTSFSASISAFSNTGPGFGAIGPMYNFGFFEDSIKYVLSIIMLIGRLEIFTILLLFLPSFWKH